LAVVLQAAMVPLLVAAGWFLRGMMPAPPPGGPSGGPMGAMPPPAVVVASVTEGPAEAPEEFLGRVEAIEEVQLMPQVAGYLDAVHFQQGGLVQEGDLLFSVDRAPFEARVALSEAGVQQAEANLAGARADLDAAKADLDRSQKYLERLQNADERSVVRADLDAASAEFLQAEARVKQAGAAIQQMDAALLQAKAALRLATIDLGYTEVRAPITGRIGEALVTAGNYVTPATGALARIVQVDPVRVVFSVPDREYVGMLQRSETDGQDPMHAQLRLPDGTLFSEMGQRDFADNMMDPETGTIAVRSRFANGTGMLVPSMHVTVMVQPSGGRTAPLIPQHAVMTDQDGDFVLIVNAQSIVEVRRVRVGPVVGDQRIVEEGLAPGEQVIVQGLQKAMPGTAVQVAAPAPTPEGA
jgi:membrane fusion protein (multidrug efflux system)